jgi:hypothetical protein
LSALLGGRRVLDHDEVCVVPGCRKRIDRRFGSKGYYYCEDHGKALAKSKPPSQALKVEDWTVLLSLRVAVLPVKRRVLAGVLNHG